MPSTGAMSWAELFGSCARHWSGLPRAAWDRRPRWWILALVSARPWSKTWYLWISSQLCKHWAGQFWSGLPASAFWALSAGCQSKNAIGLPPRPAPGPPTGEPVCFGSTLLPRRAKPWRSPSRLGYWPSDFPVSLHGRVGGHWPGLAGLSAYARSYGHVLGCRRVHCGGKDPRHTASPRDAVVRDDCARLGHAVPDW